jgi:hypothetical protein
LREPSGRLLPHTLEETEQHQQNWNEWPEKGSKKGNLAGGSSLTVNGTIIKGQKPKVSNGIHHAGTEIIGGFLLIKADNLEEATEIVRGCPIYEFDGYAEVREMER